MYVTAGGVDHASWCGPLWVYATAGGLDHFWCTPQPATVAQQMLLDEGADINAQCRDFGNALQAAASRGHNKVVQMLLENVPLGYSSFKVEALKAAQHR